MSDLIEKGKWNVGDIKHAKNGNDYRVTGFNAKGEPLWSLVNKKQGGAQQPQPAPAKQPKASEQQNGKNTDGNKPQQKVDKKPKAAPYDAPKPKVVYKNRPQHEYQVPESWRIQKKDGTTDWVTREKYRKTFADPKAMDEKKLLGLLNNPSGNKHIRQLLWEEAQARGISEDKINVSGSLQNAWDASDDDYEARHSQQEDEDDEFGSVYNSAIGDFDVESFKEQFPKGDNGWENPDDPRVKKAFHNLTSLADRQQWDSVVDLLKREDPYYEGVQDQLQALNIKMSGFLEANPKNGSAMFISTGGAGAGKIYNLLQLIENSGMHLFDPEVDKDDTASDVDLIEITEEVDNEKEFFNLLKKYNGKILIFDDKDKLLVSDATKIKSALKNIADGDYKRRKLPGGELFTGKLIFLTNKSLDTLNKDEDHKAIMSRADKVDIHFTVNENLDALKSRYKTMGGRMEGFTPQEEADLRQKVYDTIVNNVDQIDPMKFTVRKFSEMLREMVAIKNAGKKAENNADFEALFGGKGAKSMMWRRQILKMLNKADDIDIELNPANDLYKANTHEAIASLTPEQIAIFKKKYEKDPKGFEELYGKRLVALVTSKKGEEAVEKAMINDIGSAMSLEEAENLLLS